MVFWQGTLGRIQAMQGGGMMISLHSQSSCHSSCHSRMDQHFHQQCMLMICTGLLNSRISPQPCLERWQPMGNGAMQLLQVPSCCPRQSLLSWMPGLWDLFQMRWDLRGRSTLSQPCPARRQPTGSGAKSRPPVRTCSPPRTLLPWTQAHVPHPISCTS